MEIKLRVILIKIKPQVYILEIVQMAKSKLSLIKIVKYYNHYKLKGFKCMKEFYYNMGNYI
jgi:hypothetical protein